MSSPDMVNRVFDGAAAAVQCGKAITNATLGTCELIDSLTRPNGTGQQQQSYLYSRRDLGSQYAQPQIAYQPPEYPWASNQMQFGAVTQGGYPGISNPNYGKEGFVGTFMQSQQPSFAQFQSPSVNAWTSPWR